MLEDFDLKKEKNPLDVEEDDDESSFEHPIITNNNDNKNITINDLIKFFILEAPLFLNRVFKTTYINYIIT